MKQEKENFSTQMHLDCRFSSIAYSWFTAPINEKLRHAEYQLLTGIMKRLCGRCICLAGFSEQWGAQLFSKNNFVFSLGSLHLGFSSMHSSIYHWPIYSNAVDIVLLHHSLEWYTSPKRVLIETCRVLRPGGTLILVGFNPLSLLSLCCIASYRYPKELKLTKWYTVQKIKNWLNILGFIDISIDFAFRLAPFYFPIHAITRRDRQQLQIPFGSIFILEAMKERCGLLLSGQDQHSAQNIIETSYAGATCTQHHF